MKLSDFYYEFPEELVAQKPLAERDQARLLCSDDLGDDLQDRNFSELADVIRHRFPIHLFPSVLLIVNDSKVFPARLRVRRKSGARGEVFVLSTKNENEIPCLLRPQKKLRTGEEILSEASGQAVFKIIQLDPPLVANISGLPLGELLACEGEMPLPPYIERDPQKIVDPSVAALDRLRYQTVYARHEGSAAAPTAGLHFTPQVLAACSESGIKMAHVTLHVGLGTFQPVTAENLVEHQMHSELCVIPNSTMQHLIEHLKNGWPVLFVGTTSLRCVESVLLRALDYEIEKACEHERKTLSELFADEPIRIKDTLLESADQWMETRLFVRPVSKQWFYRPLCGNGIITNFHQPESTLVMLIASLVGYDRWKNIYSHAIANRYRLFSYGDSSLLFFSRRK
ncbi:tRNA preQ1(34) S-adenosylmethionine ribosyltransferase-isomerase QueA [bacterium]|nr:tRNA preQ1(34) S-adenosylmethionine ribosyltransferase-isomerase QueA [bacterium]